MATTFYFRSSTSSSLIPWRYTRGNNDARLNGSTSQGYVTRILSEGVRGAAATSIATATVDGPTNGIECLVSGVFATEWVTAPLSADVTISGTITLNLRAGENAMAANCAINAYIDRLGPNGAVVSRIGTTANTTELGTSEAAVSLNVTPTSTNMLKGDRMRIVVYADDGGGTMASANQFTFWFGGPTGGASGDSFATFTETITTDEDNPPAGTQIFLTNTASAVSTASVDREAWTSRGGGVQNDVTNTQAGFVSPIQVTDTAGGTVVDWFTKPLAAMTLSGSVLVHSRWGSSNGDQLAAPRCQIARVDNDGTNPTIWDSNGLDATLVATIETTYEWWMCGNDLAISSGQRLRIRFSIDNYAQAMLSGRTATLFYAGAAAATGDTYLTFTSTLTEAVTASDAVPFRAIVIS